jgi:hypothetical protein
MTSVFSSQRAIEALAALEQREEGMRLSEVAAAIGVSDSAAQVALRLLVAEWLVVVDGRRYRIADGDASLLLDIASRRPGDQSRIDVALRSSRAVEFAGREAGGLLVAIRWDAEPTDEVKLTRALARLPAGVAVERIGHDDLRDRLLDSPALRERAERSEIIVGSVPRSFPDPFKHGSPDAPTLGDLHPAVRRPSRAALKRLARRFGLREIRVFGSAVHADFAPDSDVDVMVRREPGRTRSLESEMALRSELESLFDRDVDVSDETVLRTEIRRKAVSEGVAIYG